MCSGRRDVWFSIDLLIIGADCNGWCWCTLRKFERRMKFVSDGEC